MDFPSCTALLGKVKLTGERAGQRAANHKSFLLPFSQEIDCLLQMPVGREMILSDRECFDVRKHLPRARFYGTPAASPLGVWGDTRVSQAVQRPCCSQGREGPLWAVLAPGRARAMFSPAPGSRVCLALLCWHRLGSAGGSIHHRGSSGCKSRRGQCEIVMALGAVRAARTPGRLFAAPWGCWAAWHMEGVLSELQHC